MSISLLNEIIAVPVNVPRYTTCHTPVIATGKEGRAPGELYYPYVVAIHEETHQMFVVNGYNDRVDIFSETGEFISQLGVGQLSHPFGLVIHGDSLYVSESDHTVSQFSLIEMCHVRRIGGEGDQTTDNSSILNNSQLISLVMSSLQIAVTTESVYTIQISTISVTSRIRPCYDHIMLKYPVTVCTYCVLITTRVCSYIL